MAVAVTPQLWIGRTAPDLPSGEHLVLGVTFVLNDVLDHLRSDRLNTVTVPTPEVARELLRHLGADDEQLALLGFVALPR